jgi:branched-chain amino acid transport system substrate-binding protein
LREKLTPLLCLLALGGCLGEDGGGSEAQTVQGDSATIYMSMPAHGVSAPAARAAEAGARLALEDAQGRAGGLQLDLETLPSTEAAEPGEEQRPWSAERVNANAELAVKDPRAIAYLGELAYGASAVSAPVTNDARLLQVSPLDGLTSMTRTPPGRPRSAPERLQPSGERNFARLVPSDLLQVETLLELVRSRGAERLAVIFDQDVYGRELAAQVIARARRDGPEPLRSEEYRGQVDEIPDIVRRTAEVRPDAIVYAGVAGPGMGRVLAQIEAQLPAVPVYGAAGLLARDPAAPIPAAPLSVEALDPVVPADALPTAGRDVLRRIEQAGGAEMARAEAAYGYEAMRLVLDAVEAGGRDRDAVAGAALDLRERSGAIGRYSMRGTGDVDGGSFALHALSEGRFGFVRMEP